MKNTQNEQNSEEPDTAEMLTAAVNLVPEFKKVLHGYDPEAVNAHIRDLTDTLGMASRNYETRMSAVKDELALVSRERDSLRAKLDECVEKLNSSGEGSGWQDDAAALKDAEIERLWQRIAELEAEKAQAVEKAKNAASADSGEAEALRAENEILKAQLDRQKADYESELEKNKAGFAAELEGVRARFECEREEKAGEFEQELAAQKKPLMEELAYQKQAHLDELNAQKKAFVEKLAYQKRVYEEEIDGCKKAAAQLLERSNSLAIELDACRKTYEEEHVLLAEEFAKRKGETERALAEQKQIHEQELADLEKVCNEEYEKLRTSLEAENATLAEKLAQAEEEARKAADSAENRELIEEAHCALNENERLKAALEEAEAELGSLREKDESTRLELEQLKVNGIVLTEKLGACEKETADLREKNRELAYRLTEECGRLRGEKENEKIEMQKKLQLQGYHIARAAEAMDELRRQLELIGGALE